jgi:hypothetical protein
VIHYLALQMTEASHLNMASPVVADGTDHFFDLQELAFVSFQHGKVSGPSWIRGN